jgi:hypothetical protein
MIEARNNGILMEYETFDGVYLIIYTIDKYIVEHLDTYIGAVKPTQQLTKNPS